MGKLVSNLYLASITSSGRDAELVQAHGMGLVLTNLLCGTHVLPGGDGLRGSRCYELLRQPLGGLHVLGGLDPFEIWRMMGTSLVVKPGVVILIVSPTIELEV